MEKCRTSSDGSTLKTTPCPTCHYEMDAATCTDGDHRPKSGDMSVCAKCGEILIFDDDVVPRIPTLSELITLPEDVSAQLNHVQNAIRRERPIK